jgi:hypothetical protein
MREIKLIKVLAFTLLIAACAPSTVMTGSWKNPNLGVGKSGYKHLFIAAMTSDLDVRSKMESALAVKAKERGLEVTQSMDVFPPGFTKNDIPSKEKLAEIIRGTKSDVILTVAVKSKKEETRYVPGSATTMYAPYPRYGYYGGFYGYYGQTYQNGYYTTDEIVFLETNLYDVESEELIWSGQTKTTNATNFDSFFREYYYAILDRMQKDGIVQGGPKK